MKKLLSALLLLFLGICPSSSAQTQPAKIKVGFVCGCGDPIAQQFATKFRDMLAASPRYVEGSTNDDADSAKWILSVVTMPIGEKPNQSPNASAWGIVLMWKASTMSQSVQVCSLDKVTACTSEVFSDMDNDIQKHKILNSLN